MGVIVDTREKGSFPEKVMDAYPDATKMVLSGGDYLIPKDKGNIVIERMTLSDFCGKIKSGRLWKQLDKCKRMSDDVYFIIEYIGKMQSMNMSIISIWSCIASLSREVKIIPVRNSTETFYILDYLYRKYNDPKRKVTRQDTRLAPKNLTPHEQAIYCLMGGKGIGYATASKALEKYNIRDLARMDKIDLIRLLGHKTADKIWEMFNG